MECQKDVYIFFEAYAEQTEAAIGKETESERGKGRGSEGQSWAYL